jgi:hypothetical protein
VVEAAEILASWVRDDGEKADVIYASPSFQGSSELAGQTAECLTHR